MKLDLIVPHYQEPWETCKYLFDSLALQRGIDFENIRVIVVNDGDSIICGDYNAALSVFMQYPYRIDYLLKEHGGVSAARNYGLDNSDADYVMFCDIDDGFLSNYGLHLIFSAMSEGFDMLVSTFIEESFTKDTHVPIILPRNDDMTFVHGKVYRREFLNANNLRFDPELTIHEDGYFNIVTYTVAKNRGKVKKVQTPFYLWAWNDSSVVRSNKNDFVLRTYLHLMAARMRTCDELFRRGFDKEFRVSVCMTVLNSYYDFQKSSYHEAKNERYLRMAERAFKNFWTGYSKVFKDCTYEEIADVATTARANAVANGMLIEHQDLMSFLKHIDYDVK